MKEVILLAMGPSRIQCLFDAETWALNTGYRQVADMKGRIDKLFLAHCQVYDKDHKPYFDWNEINNLKVEVINTHRVRKLKSKQYPFKAVIRKFETDYFSDTIAYMLAYALHKYTYRRKDKVFLKEPLKLRLYGADMLEHGEYQLEKGGIEFWLGLARGLGAKVEISKGSHLLRTYNGVRYGSKQTKVEDYLNKFMTSSTDPNAKVYYGELQIDLGKWIKGQETLLDAIEK